MQAAPERALSPLLGHLGDQHVLPPAASATPRAPTDELLERYRRYLVERRDLAPRTVPD